MSRLHASPLQPLLCLARSAPAGRTAVLVDLENIAHALIGEEWVGAADLDRRLRAILLAGRGADYVMVVAGAHVFSRYLTASTVLSTMPMRTVPPERDAADLALCDLAEHLAGRGFTRFVIASGDHLFADFAARHRVAVVVPTRNQLAATLASHAESVRIAS